MTTYVVTNTQQLFSLFSLVQIAVKRAPLSQFTSSAPDVSIFTHSRQGPKVRSKVAQGNALGFAKHKESEP